MAGALRLPVVVLLGATTLVAQAPDANAVLRGAGVDVPRGGAQAAFDAGLIGPSPVPPGAFGLLIVGMGPVGDAARARSAYAFGVLAGRSGRHVPAGELAGAGIALLQMIVSPDRRVRVAGCRVSGHVFATPIDGGPPPARPVGLAEAITGRLGQPHEDEQAAAIEALGLLGERGGVPVLTDVYQQARSRNRRRLAGTALEALTRIAHPATVPLAQALVGDPWGDRDDVAGLAVAFARERFLEDGSARRLEAALSDRRLGSKARAYLVELGRTVP